MTGTMFVRPLGITLTLVGMILLAVPPAWAQEPGTIQGRVVNAVTGAPLPGTQVVIAGTSRGALAGRDGTYVLRSVPPGTLELRATRIGYGSVTESVTVSAGGTASVDFLLREVAIEIEGVVVSAIGQRQLRREIGNSVATLRMDDIETGPVNTIQELLSGRAAGVTVRQGGGTTGQTHRIRIRGANSASLSNEPLIVIDGIRVSNIGPQFTSTSSDGQTASRLNDLDPEHIESIEILKGPAAAALYGTAGANGVIQIRTRRGEAGQLRWRVYSEYGTVEEESDFPESVRAFDGSTLCPLAFSDASQAEGNCTPTRFERFDVLGDPRTTPFRSGRRQQSGVSASGGSSRATFFISVDDEREDGVYRSNELDRTNVRANFRGQLTDRLDVSGSSGFVVTRLTLPQNDNNAFSMILNGLLGETALPEDDPCGIYRLGLCPDEVETRREASDTDRFVGSLSADWRALDWLTINGTAGVDYIGQHDHTLQEAGTRYAIFGSPFAEGFRESHRIQNWTYSALTSAQASYALSPDVQLTSSAGVNLNHSILRRTQGFGAGLLGGTSSLAGTSSLFSVTEQNQEIVTLGGFLRQQVSYRDRLFVSGSVRGDDDSAFGEAFDLIIYPAAQVAWVASEEDFFPRLPGLSQLRLRAAFGESGLRPGFRQAQTFFTAQSVALSGTDVSAITVGGTGNPELKPERTREWELGFDLGLFQDRVGLETTVYRKTSRDALVSRRLAPSLGLSESQFVNLASVENEGLEATLRSTLLDRRHLRLAVDLNASWNSNEVLGLGEGVDDIVFGVGGDSQRHTEGHSLGSYFTRRIVSYDDADGNGILTPDEVELTDEPEFVGHSLPTRQVAVSPTLTLLGHVRLSAHFEHQGGHRLNNHTRFFRCGTSVGFFRCDEAFDPETPVEDQLPTAAWFAGASREGFMEKADFWKLRELALTLTLPPDWAGRYTRGALSGADLTISGRNLATWTDYSGVDPEMNNSGPANFATADFFTQAPVRYWTARVSVTF